MDLIEVTRRSFKAVAVRVTEENVADVAAWCGGAISSSRVTEHRLVWFVQLPITYGLSKRRTSHAFVGNWIVKNGEHFAVYKDASFKGTFELRGEDDLKKKREKALEILQEYTFFLERSAWSGGGEGYEEAVQSALDDIMKLIEGET